MLQREYIYIDYDEAAKNIDKNIYVYIELFAFSN